jgi:hypothetical protein
MTERTVRADRTHKRKAKQKPTAPEADDSDYTEGTIHEFSTEEERAAFLAAAHMREAAKTLSGLNTAYRAPAVLAGAPAAVMLADAGAPAVLALAPDAVMLADAGAPAVLAVAPAAVAAKVKTLWQPARPKGSEPMSAEKVETLRQKKLAYMKAWRSAKTEGMSAAEVAESRAQKAADMTKRRASAKTEQMRLAADRAAMGGAAARAATGGAAAPAAEEDPVEVAAAEALVAISTLGRDVPYKRVRELVDAVLLSHTKRQHLPVLTDPQGHVLCFCGHKTRCAGQSHRKSDCPLRHGTDSSNCEHVMKTIQVPVAEPVPGGPSYTKTNLYRKRSTCIICTPRNFCEHNRRRGVCKDCGGASGAGKAV